ncbi:MAG: hypothetical protein QM605_10390 [Sphingobium sp.]
MTKKGVLTREQDPVDRRRLYVRLSPEVKSQMHAYLRKVAGGSS